MNNQRVANVILGSYLNGYSIIQELSENDISEIIVVDVEKDVSAYSNKIVRFIKINNSSDSIFSTLRTISESYDLLILYPNQDIYVEYLSKIYPKIKDYCFIAFNHNNAIECQDKMVQYDFCNMLGIPCPSVMLLKNVKDLEKLYSFTFPILLKPTKRDNLSTNVFRTLMIQNSEDVSSNTQQLSNYFEKGVSFVASEIIPGTGSNIHAYTAYRSSEGKILGEWTGKKLSQFPNDYGVFSSASNQSSSIVLEQGRKLLHGMNLFGINEPEFKYDYRDGKYKLMEINLRPMMWHRVGALSGVPLNYIQYLDATNQKTPEYTQNRSIIIHYVYHNHELINLFYRSNYYSIFKNNLWGGQQRVFALWDKTDPLPFFRSFLSVIKRYMRLLKRKKDAVT
ncbi:MAG: D-aspartate ligase [Parvicella sp.]|jgi:D-aspartate ligase